MNQQEILIYFNLKILIFIFSAYYIDKIQIKLISKGLQGLVMFKCWNLSFFSAYLFYSWFFFILNCFKMKEFIIIEFKYLLFNKKKMFKFYINYRLEIRKKNKRFLIMKFRRVLFVCYLYFFCLLIFLFAKISSTCSILFS